eukprot:Pgem_evm2s17627
MEVQKLLKWFSRYLLCTKQPIMSNIDQLTEQLKTMKIEKDTQELEKHQLEILNLDLRKQADELETKLDSYEVQLEEMVKRAEDAEQVLNNISEELMERNKERGELVTNTEVEEAFRIQIQQTDNHIEQLEKENAGLENKIMEANNRIEHLEQELEEDKLNQTLYVEAQEFRSPGGRTVISPEPEGAGTSGSNPAHIQKSPNMEIKITKMIPIMVIWDRRYNRLRNKFKS